MSNACEEFDFRENKQSPSGNDLDTSKLPSLPRVPIWKFQSDDIILHGRQAVNAELSRLDVTVLAENERLGIIATGDDFREALQDFQDQVIHLYRYFSSQDDLKLTDKAKELKQLLITNFVPSS